ncbi:MAG: hypothetical protein P1U56_15870 [Saprospiraceae bacterium]|nr:hypothetical protein [Saprospiraceae bacterium]
MGNQKGNYTYEVNQKYREQEERYKASDAVAVQELEENKKELPRVIIERIKKRQIDLRKLKKVVVSASGPLRSKFDLSMEFYPAEMTIENLAISSFKYESKSILKGLEALNKKSSFILEIYGEKEWKYIFDENFLW